MATPGGSRNCGRAAPVEIASRRRRTPFPGAQFPTLTIPPLGQQSLRKIYPLRQFRHLATQLLQPRRQLLLPRRERGARFASRLQLGGVRFAQGPDDQPAEKAAEQDDGDRSEEHTSELQSPCN